MRGVRVGRPEGLWALERVGMKTSSQIRTLAFSKHGTAGRHEAGRSIHHTPDFPAGPRGTILGADWNRAMSDRVNRGVKNSSDVDDDRNPREEEPANQAFVLSGFWQGFVGGMHTGTNRVATSGMAFFANSYAYPKASELTPEVGGRNIESINSR